MPEAKPNLKSNELVAAVARELVVYAPGAFEAPFRDDEGNLLNPPYPPFTPNDRCGKAAEAAIDAYLAALKTAGYEVVLRECEFADDLDVAAAEIAAALGETE